MSIEIVVFQTLKDVKVLELPPSLPASGKKFEDFMVQQLYQKLRQQRALDIFPPRYTLRETTYSGVAHQFDIIIRHGELTAIECKFRKNIGISDLFAFVGKLIDYQKPPYGLFVTTAENVNKDIFCYAIAHRILLVCSFLPPIEYMNQRVKKDSDIARRLERLQTRLYDNKNVPNHLLVEWQNAYRRFAMEGYN